MFSEEQGPTALRADMVHALAFSVEDVQIDTPSGSERCVAALAAVWNGRQGFVAFLVRSLQRPLVRRFAWSEPLENRADLEAAIEEGMGFGASLGFFMDDPPFLELPRPHQDTRLERWNRLRKPNRTPMPGAPVQPKVEIEAVGELDDSTLTGIDPADMLDVETDATILEAAPPAGERAETAEPPTTVTGTVLGKVRLVQQDDSEARRQRLGRLLSHF